MAAEIEQLQEVDRRRTAFLAALAHELRSPLAPIRSGLELLGSSDGDEELARSVVEVVTRQVDHIARLVDDLFDLARISRGKLSIRPQPVDLSTILADAVEFCRPRISEAKQRLEIDIRESVTLMADHDRLTQVFANLLSNASRYTPDGGSISLCVERRERTVFICVRDSGIGIESHHLHEIFEPYTQLDVGAGRSKGLGLGLSLVRSLVELHGGRVVARSEGRGKGSEFRVGLPLMPTTAEK